MSSRKWHSYTVTELVKQGMLERPLDGNHGAIHPKSCDYVPLGVPFIMATDLHNGTIDFDKCSHITEKQAASLKKGFAKPGDVLLTHKATIGRTAIVSSDYPTIVLTPQVTYYRVKEGILNKYLKYYFDTPQFQDLLRNWSGSGSTRSYISITEQGKLPVIVPPLPEQRAIAATLSCLDDKIELNNRMNKTLEEMAQAIFKSWFVDFEPFQNGEFVDSELGRIPKGWRVGSLDECIELFDYKRVPLSSRERASMDKLYPYYGATSLMDYVNSYIFDGVYVLLGEDGSVVDSEGYPILQYVWGKFWVNNHAHILKGRNGYDEQSIYMLLKNTNIQSIVTGAVQLKINQANLKSVRVLIPDEPTLKRFNMMAFDIFQLKRQLREESDLLVSTRDILLPKLMSGEIRVPTNP